MSGHALSSRYSRTVTLRISKELDEVLDKVSRELGYRSKSDFVRDAISEYIDYLLSMVSPSDEGDYEGVESESAAEVKLAKVIMV